jgi:predicted CoA-binding protein
MTVAAFSRSPSARQRDKNSLMETPSYSHDYIRAILERTRTIATVGVSLNDVRPSYYVARYLKLKGYKVIPINPRYAGTHAFGETVVESLDAIPRENDPIDMVDIFRRSEEAGDVVDEAIEALLDRGLKTIWMQFGVINWEAAKRAEAKGLTVIMNHCPKIEYQRLWGELRWGGFNTGVISSKLR